MAVFDALHRPLGTLRLSVTDRCNLRCHYCMPGEEYGWLPRRNILTFEEIERLVEAFGELGVRRIRLTGGEPLLRRDLPQLVTRLSAKPWVHDLALTTNGVRLADLATDLKRAGLGRVTVSLDTLRRDRFARISRADALPRVFAGIEAARHAGFVDLKLDTVVVRGSNDDELVDLVEFARAVGAEIRFIEYMDVGGATGWHPEAVVSRADLLERLREVYGPSERLHGCPHATAGRYRLPDGLTFGIISSVTAPFCRACDRVRLTADGMLFPCLYATRGTPLGALARAGASREVLLEAIRAVWSARADRGAEDRRALRHDRLPAALVPQADLHFQMHTRGG